MQRFYLIFNKKALLLALFFASMLVGSCSKTGHSCGDHEFVEREARTVEFVECEVSYMGDDIGERSSDGWIVKLYTDMDIDETGNPIGPGAVMQLLLNVRYNEAQEPEVQLLEGRYTSQINSGDYSSGSFVYGYMDYIDLPAGRVERPDGTFYADVADGSTSMEADLIDDGAVQITDNGDGTHTIEGTLVGKKCLKRRFIWRGTIEPRSYVKPQTPNTTLEGNLRLTTLTHALLQDRGDYFYLRDESCRSLLLFLADEDITFSYGKPQGSGRLLRLELLVPWSCDVADGIPAGTYPMLTRNADTSIDRDKLTPYHAVPGLPNSFSYPYWAGAWYVEMTDGVWSERYACLVGGHVIVERGEDGSHRITCHLEDCAEPRNNVTTEVTLSKESLTIY